MAIHSYRRTRAAGVHIFTFSISVLTKRQLEAEAPVFPSGLSTCDEDIRAVWDGRDYLLSVLDFSQVVPEKYVLAILPKSPRC